MAWYDGLSEKQRKFCEAYAANGGNALAAAREAGYAHAKTQASRLLENTGIRQALEQLRESTTSAAIATREERQSFWTRTLRDESLEMSNRLRASELLGKSQADFLDRKELTGKDGAPLSVSLKFIDS